MDEVKERAGGKCQPEATSAVNVGAESSGPSVATALPLSEQLDCSEMAAVTDESGLCCEGRAVAVSPVFPEPSQSPCPLHQQGTASCSSKAFHTYLNRPELSPTAGWPLGHPLSLQQG